MTGTAVAVVAAFAGCRREPPGDPPIPITIATGGSGGSFAPLGATLARIYSTRLPGVQATAVSTVASVFNVQAVQQGRVDVAFTQGDVAYFAYRRGTEHDPLPHTRLRGIAVLWVNTVQLVTRRDSDIRAVAGLRTRRVGVGSQASGTELAARMVIEGHGFKYSDVRAEFLSFSEVASRMETGTLDAGFVVASYPVSAVTDMNESFGIRLIPMSPAIIGSIRSQYPFMRPMLIPTGTYAGQDREVTTVGVDNILVCRADLPEEVVYDLTRVFFDAVEELARTDIAATRIDPDLGPTTPIPLHPGAARFYRERRLLQ
jgi:uncharacterized protein